MKYLPFLLFLFCFLPLKVSFADSACNNIGGRAGKNYSIINLDIVDATNDYAPYLMGYGVLANFTNLSTRDAEYDDNIGEWRSIFCSIPDSSDIEKLVYESSIDQLKELRAAAEKPKADLYFSLMNNTFAQVLRTNGCVYTIDYLIYAKLCEKALGFEGNMDNWGTQTRNTAEVYRLIGLGRKQFRSVDGMFLKLRYMYQMVRMAHYIKDYQAVLTIYDELYPKLDPYKSIMNYWILGHKAGALQALGKRAEAAYLFGVVFRYCPSKRKQAFLSFSIRTEDEWRECLNFCKTDEERAAMYAIRASYDKAKALDDMREIYYLDPRNEHLDMLLVRETLKLEKVLLGYQFRRERYPKDVIDKNLTYLQRLQVFVSFVANQKKAKTPALWRATEGYLWLLRGNWREARPLFYEAEKMTDNEALKIQLRNFGLATTIIGWQGVDKGLDTIYTEVRNAPAFASNDAFDHLFKEKLASMYREQNNAGVSFLLDYEQPDLELNPDLAVIESLIALCQKEDRSLLEDELVLLPNSTRTIESQLWDIKGRYHLAHFQIEAAYDAFVKVPQSEFTTYFPAFSEQINDAPFKLNAVKDTTSLNRFEFVQKMIDLDFQSKADARNAAKYHFLLGLGFYNMTFFGSSAGLADYYTSAKTWQYLKQGNPVVPKTKFARGNYETVDVARAMLHFEQARQLAVSDRELQAKAAFWAAKCEFVQYLTSADNHYALGSRYAPAPPPQYRRYFALLKTYYSNTAFYQQAKSECKYFNFYVSK